MKLLVCGMHRSGTSAVATMTAYYSGCTFLNDPRWAIPPWPPAMLSSAEVIRDLGLYEIVKAPRLTEVLPTLLEAYQDMRVAVLLRDPRDVLASILEKLYAGRSSGMLTFPGIVEGTGVEAFAEAFQRYLHRIRGAIASHPDRVALVSYEDFHVERRQTVEFVISFARLQKDGQSELDENIQFGPPRNKVDPHRIAGPGRYRDELSPLALRQVHAAVAAWSRIRSDLAEAFLTPVTISNPRQDL